MVGLSVFGNATAIDINQLASVAKKSKRTILVFLHQPNCGFCSEMIAKTIKDISVQSQIKKDFIFVDIDIADGKKVKYKNFKGSKEDFAKKTESNFYPSTVFIDSNGKIVYKLIGYKTKKSFLDVLSYIQSKSYKKMNLATYQNSLDFNNDED